MTLRPPPPGWFPDPTDDRRSRWWDGTAWTEHTQGQRQAIIHTDEAVNPSPGFHHTQTGTKKPWYFRWWAIAAAVLIGLTLLGSLLPDEQSARKDASSHKSDAPGTTADSTPPAAETEPRPEPVDSDADGVNDDEDYRPKDPKVQTQDDVDTDKDGVPDYKDAFPKNATYSKDADGDRVADELDAFPKNASYSKDDDGDRVANSEDAFPRDPSRSKISVSMENALSAAENYLDTMPFSRQGLIDQLSSEYGSGFSVEDATWAVSQLGADWKQEAVEAAKNYLDTMPFSRQGLIDQLSSAYGSKFTTEEAVYAVNKVGL